MELLLEADTLRLKEHIRKEILIVRGTIREDLPGFAQEIRNILPGLLKEQENDRKKGRNDRGMGF